MPQLEPHVNNDVGVQICIKATVEQFVSGMSLMHSKKRFAVS